MLRAFDTTDFEQVLQLNQDNTPEVGSLDAKGLQWHVDNNDYFKVFEQQAEIVGFLIGYLPGADYQSPNYQWFESRYAKHCYIDRIAIAKAGRGQGLASKFYQDFEQFGLAHGAEYLSCEVNVKPANPASMAFHQKLGFTEVGQQATEGGSKVVSLLIRRY